MGNVLGGLEPKLVWDIFEEITQVPRPSKKEEKIAQWVKDFGVKHNLTCVTDALGNVVLKKPATAGMENRKGVVLQGHLDMVCEKNSDVEFDFDNDPLNIYVDGDWVKAKGTTLGADNGIGVAMSLAVMASNNVAHPHLELLCTLDEETGLTGAIQLGKGMLDGDILINLDSEEDGAFTIGCAGGLNTSGTFPYKAEAVPADSVAYEVAIKGLKGGHSGIEIHDYRGNAIKMLNRILWNSTKAYGIRINSFVGGNKHNAIPREAFALITLPKAKEQEFLAMITMINDVLKAEWISKEPGINVIATAKPLPSKVVAMDVHNNLLNALYAMPHGQMRLNPDIAGLVQTSTNCAIIETRENEFYVLTSQRSAAATEITDIGDMVATVFTMANAKVEQGDGYPGWTPNVHSPLLKLSTDVYKNLTGKDAKVEAIHAGLECGLVGEKYPGMDMISFGPTLKDVHSPDEKVQISTVGNCWKLLLEILKNIPEKN